MQTTGGCLILFSFLIAGISRAGNEERPNPEGLISRARLQQDIWTEGTPPMLMRAEIQVADAKDTLVKGGYTLNWVSPTKWREEIRFANYERIRVRDANGYWQKTGLDYQPEFMFQLDTLLHVKDALRVRSSQTLENVKKRENGGVQQSCIEIRWKKGTDRIICFDAGNGAAVSVEYPRGKNQNPPEISQIEYSAFDSMGEKLVPYVTRALRERNTILSVKIQSIEKAKEENLDLFRAPAGSEFWTQCDDEVRPELVSHIHPQYPSRARVNRIGGREIFYAVIETDGSLSHITAIQSAYPDLEAAAFQAIRQWRFKPAICGQTAIRTETTIPVDFWVEH